MWWRFVFCFFLAIKRIVLEQRGRTGVKKTWTNFPRSKQDRDRAARRRVLIRDLSEWVFLCNSKSGINPHKPQLCTFDSKELRYAVAPEEKRGTRRADTRYPIIPSFIFPSCLMPRSAGSQSDRTWHILSHLRWPKRLNILKHDAITPLIAQRKV